MRLNEITILENSKHTVEFAMRLINRDCKPYLAANPNWLTTHKLFHGSQMEINTIMQWHGKKIREPRDTSNYDHMIVNNAFVTMKYKANRGNSIFCTGSELIAREYGYPYYLVPCGKFNFTWAPNITDLANDSSRRSDIFSNLKKNPPNHSIIKKYYNSEQNSTISDAIASKREIMIQCTKFYFVNINFIHGKERT